MRTIWGKIKHLFSRIWTGLTVAGRIVVGIWIICLIALASFLTIRHNNNTKDNEDNKTVEVTQVYEPSIGSPLPADNPGAVAGDSTTVASTNANSTDDTATMMAPHTGIDPSEPIAYENDVLKFTATLPAGSEVKELETSVEFNSARGMLQYLVSVQTTADETLKTIEAELHNSPTVSHISSTTISGVSALKFEAKGYGTGLTFIANGQIYYLLGNSQYFTGFKIL